MTDEQRAELIIGADAAEPIRGFEVSWYDEEADEVMVVSFHDEQRAIAEYEDVEELEDAALREATVWRPSAWLRKSWKDEFGGELPEQLVEDFAIVEAAERTTDLDGAWWDDDLDVHRLTAPRGVIFQSALDQWEARKV
jgi:hypothetical protein